MVRLRFIFILTFSLSFFVGCQEFTKKESQAKSKIPKVMVGVWESQINDNVKWAFKIESDGSVSKLVHPLAGPVDVKQGGYENAGPDPNTFEAFIMGPCETSFDIHSRIFTVHIILDGFILKLPQGELIGTSDDYLQGSISKDGKIWKADWFNYSALDGASAPDTNEIKANPQKLIFTKTIVKTK